MKLLKKMTLSALFIISVTSDCFAENIDYPKNLWKGLIGEAVSEFTKFGYSAGYESMYASACVYRKRFHEGEHFPWGCVALTRKDLDQFVGRERQKYKDTAKEIIRKVFIENGPDITDGATHYENVEKFGLPKGWEKMKKIKKIGSHTYFKEK